MEVLQHVSKFGTRDKAFTCSTCKEQQAMYAIGDPLGGQSFSACDKPSCVAGVMEQLIGCGCKSVPQTATLKTESFEYMKPVEMQENKNSDPQMGQIVVRYPSWPLTSQQYEQKNYGTENDDDDVQYGRVFLANEQEPMKMTYDASSDVSGDYAADGYDPDQDPLFSNSSTTTPNVSEPIGVEVRSRGGFRAGGNVNFGVRGDVGIRTPRRYMNGSVVSHPTRVDIPREHRPFFRPQIRRIPPRVRGGEHWRPGNYLKPLVRPPRIAWNPAHRAFAVRPFATLDRLQRGRGRYLRSLLIQRRRGVPWNVMTWRRYYELLLWYSMLGFNIGDIYGLIPDEDLGGVYYDNYGPSVVPQSVPPYYSDVSLGVGIPDVSLTAGF